jgi:hypothetical protein
MAKIAAEAFFPNCQTPARPVAPPLAGSVNN